MVSEMVSPLLQSTDFSLISLARNPKFSFICEELIVDPDVKTFGAVRLSEAKALPSRQEQVRMIAAMIFLFIF